MRKPLFVLIALLLVSATRASNRFISLDFTKQVERSASNLHKRDQNRKSLSQPIENGLLGFKQWARYYANITIGTPPQSIAIELDTGSSDLVINTPYSELCSQASAPCVGSTYDANASSTYHYVSGNASASYGGGDVTSGDFVTDTTCLGSVCLLEVQFAAVYSSTAVDSIWGLSYSIDEQQSNYPSITDLMVSAGAINTPAYSLWLNSQSSPSGAILFGGVNKAKYSGILHTIPFEQGWRNFASQFAITNTGIGLTVDGTGPSTPFFSTPRQDPYLVDSGTWDVVLPDDLFRPILAAVGGEYESSAGISMVPCALRSNNSTLDFNFTSFSISVPFSEFISTPYVWETTLGNTVRTLSDGHTPACDWGMSPGGKDFILGASFMRSTYLVFDLANNELSMAQARFDVMEDDILEIPAGSGPVPGAQRVLEPAVASKDEEPIANMLPLATGTWSYVGPAPTDMTMAQVPPWPTETTASTDTSLLTRVRAAPSATASKSAAAGALDIASTKGSLAALVAVAVWVVSDASWLSYTEEKPLETNLGPPTKTSALRYYCCQASSCATAYITTDQLPHPAATTFTTMDEKSRLLNRDPPPLPTSSPQSIPLPRAPRRFLTTLFALILAGTLLYSLPALLTTNIIIDEAELHKDLSHSSVPFLNQLSPVSREKPNNTALVPLEAHIMSKCPDARDCLRDLVVPAMEKVVDKVDFKLNFIGQVSEDETVKCMHGPTECLGNILILCAQSLYPNSTIVPLGFANCMISSFSRIPERTLIEDCALEHGVDFKRLNACASDEKTEAGMDLLRGSVERSRKAGVKKSCTVRLEGKIRCVRDGGKWEECDGGEEVGDLVGDVEMAYEKRQIKSKEEA